MALAAGATILHDVSLFPDQPPPTAPAAKPKLTSEARRARYSDWLAAIRLHMLIFRKLEDRASPRPLRSTRPLRRRRLR
jgi:hypothetical protein